MPVVLSCVLLAVMLPNALARESHQGADDPVIRAAVERFFAIQEAEDIQGYLALWSSRAPRSHPEQLPAQVKFIFDSGDDTFSDIVITRVTPYRDTMIVRVSATRDRTVKRPDGTASTFHMPLSTSLTFVREGDSLKLIAEGPPTDGLAAALLDAASASEREELLALDPELVTDFLVRSLSRLADAAAQQLQYAASETIYERVLDVARRIGNRKAEGEALQNIANARYFQRNFAGALQAYEQRLAVEREAASDEGIASSLLGIATTHYSTYEYGAALVSYEEAVKLQEKLEDAAGAATTRISMGNVRYLQGDFEGAIPDFRRSRDGWRKIANPPGEARALEGLGRVFAAQGDLSAALEAYAGVLEEGRARGDRSTQGTAIQYIGEIHFRLGNLDTARARFDESRGHFEAMNDQANVGRVWQAAALTDLVAGRFAPAEQEYTKSGSACGVAKDRACVARAVVGLAFAQAAQEHFDEAIATYGKAIAAFVALERREEAARAEIGLAQALLGRKDNDLALAAAGRVRQQAAVRGPDDVLWRALIVEARAHRRLKAPDTAIAAAREATAIVERMAKAALDRPGEALAEDTIAPYALLAVLQADAGDPAGAFATAEQRRALALRISLARNERDIARGMTASEREAERALAAELVTLNVRLVRERDLPRPDAARISLLAQAISGVAAKRQLTEQRLFDRLPDLRLWRGLAPAAIPPDVAKALPADSTVLAEFVIDVDDLLVVTGARVEDHIEFRAYVNPIARQALADRIWHATDSAVLRSEDAWRKASMDLVSAIPAAALDQLAAARRAIIVPDDVLWMVPFEALPIKAGYLGDRTTIAYASSVTSLVGTPAVLVAPQTAPVFAIGAPEISAAVRDRVKTTAPGWILRTPESADMEIRRTAQGLHEPSATVLAGPSATETAFRTQAQAAPVLHLAAPFRINSASPLFSPVLLAGERAGKEDPATDGVLEAREIMNLDLHASVAVLSDGAAVSMRDAAMAVETVQWAWRAAGVASLVLPRWAGEDAAKSEMLAVFHTHLKQGDSLSGALQAARDAVRTREETRAPYFWAGWMIVGGS